MERIVHHMEGQLRRMAEVADEKFTMLNEKYEREVSELQNEVESVNEGLDSVDYYAEAFPEAYS